MKKIVISIFLSMTLCAHAAVSLPDSFLTERKAIELTLSNPSTSYAIIQAMRQRKLVTSWRLDCLEGEYYINQRKFRRVVPLLRRVLDDPAVSAHTDLQMEIMLRLMYTYDHLLEDNELTEYVYRLQRMAEQHHNDFYLSHTLFMYGKRLHYQGDNKGLSYCRDAIALLTKSDNPRKNNSLRTFYAEMLLMYQSDGRYNDAVRMSLLQEEIARVPSAINMRYVDQRAMRLVYALRASLYAEMDDIEDADKAYARWLKTKGGNPIDDKYILGYLEAKGLHDESLRIIEAYKKHLSQEQDSVSHWMLTMLGHEAIIYGMLGRVDESLVTAKKIKSLTETLHKQESREMMTTVNKFLREKDEYSRRTIMQMSFGFVGFFLFMTIAAFILYMLYYYQRYKKLSGIFRHIASKFSKTAGDEAVVPVHPEPADLQEEELVPSALPSAKLAQLYRYMDRKVTREKLFLNPDLSREDLMRILGIDKNRFGKMMARYSDAGNVSGYISKKRVEYGAELLRNHPEYTIATIAEMSGVSSTVNFNRIFRHVYGVTPSEYRKNQEE